MATRDLVLLLSMIATSLLSGRAVWTWLGENPENVSGRTFVEFFQALDRGVATPMAIVGLGAVVLTAISAILFRSERVVLYLLAAACVLCIASSAVTIAFHLPINARIAAWDPNALPAEYVDYLRSWWRWHHVRLITTVTATLAVFVAVLVRKP